MAEASRGPASVRHPSPLPDFRALILAEDSEGDDPASSIGSAGTAGSGGTLDGVPLNLRSFAASSHDEEAEERLSRMHAAALVGFMPSDSCDELRISDHDRSCSRTRSPLGRVRRGSAAFSTRTHSSEGRGGASSPPPEPRFHSLQVELPRMDLDDFDAEPEKASGSSLSPPALSPAAHRSSVEALPPPRSPFLPLHRRKGTRVRRDSLSAVARGQYVSAVPKTPDQYTQEELEEVALAMRAPDTGLRVKNRTHHFRKYKSTFTGRECVTWLVENGGCLSRSEAVELGCFLMDIGVFFHILNEHRLKDEVLFYRFAAEWKPTELAASAAIEEAVQVWPDGSELVPAVLLTKEEIDKLVKDLTSCDGGLDIRDRKQRLRTFKQCFPGSELVTWLVERRVALNRTEGVAVARFLQQRGIVVHITRSHRFHDRSDYLYFIDTLGTRDPFEQKAEATIKSACGGRMSNIKAVLVGYGLTPSVQLCFLEAAATRLKENGAPPISDKLAASMAYFHFRYGELGSFLSHVMVRELGGFDDETVLFREASITTALLKMSFKMIPMINSFVRRLVGGLLQALGSREKWEVDPAKLTAGEILESKKSGSKQKGLDTRDNARLLGNYTAQFLYLFLELIDSFPVFLRRFLIRTEKQVERRFRGMGRSIVGNFLFLRIIGPAIVAPAEHGLAAVAPNAAQRKGAVMISRILQKVATSNLFDKKTMPHAEYLNGFVSRLIPIRDSIYEQLLDPHNVSGKRDHQSQRDNGEKQMLTISAKILCSTLRRHSSALVETLATSMTVIPTGTPDTWTAREVSTWLDIIGMQKYSSKVLSQNIDGLTMMAQCLATESWSFCVDMHDQQFMREQLKAIVLARNSERFRFPNDVMEWRVVDVCNWLQYLGFHQYSSLFEEAEIDGVNLLSLTEEELVPVGVPDPGHRAVILRAIDQRNLQS